uniref:DENN/MADD domain containing 6B n=1 Tax=Hippocampus comes TaxID=109280 RepID=A0A3Q2XLD6_HIPCM
RFSSWLECACVVTFDLELGQAIELVYPPDVKLTEKEKSSLCYLSFPDSYSCIGDTQFSFRMRQSVGRRHSRPRNDRYNKDAPAALQSEASHFYGYVYFRQVKDPSVKRGYFQKSLVLLSRLPFIQLFHSVLRIVAPDFFHKSQPCPGPTLLPSVHEPDLFCFRSVLIHLQLLWELALLGEPVVVMAPSPAASSETVWALVCIAPLKFCCDFRPYFTVHDGEFREYTTRTQARPNVILGVTNPFFIKTFHNWPHVLRLGENATMSDVPKQLKIKKVAKLKTLDTKPVFTAYKSFLLKDKVLVKRLLKGIQRRRPSEVQSAILRRHFSELTHSFIGPLERYMAGLMPPRRSVTPWKTPPQIRPFAQEEFMSALERDGPRPTSAARGDWAGLYKFFKSPNFDGWYRHRLREMSGKLESLHLEVICEAQDLLGWTRDKSEVEIVDLVVKLREKLTRAARQRPRPTADPVRRLESLIGAIVSSLPKDLQAVLRAQ